MTAVGVAGPGPGPALVESVLSAHRLRTRRAVLEYVPADGPRAELYDLVSECLLEPGKGIRPALCLATCRAHGGESEEALGAAVAIELLHTAFLVHDDICDQSSRRRGREALHVRHGVPLALNAGDGMAWLALRPLLDNANRLGPRLTLEVLAEFDHLTRRTIEGQAAELGRRERGLDGLTVDEYLRIVLDKTCWYSAIHPCRVGALIGSRGRADLEGVARFGFFLGAVLQIRDDIENVTAPVEATGKDRGSDVVEGKPTLLLIHLLRTASAGIRDEVLGLVGPAGEGAGLPREARIAHVVSLMEEHGSIDFACAFADGLAGSALAEFDAAMGGLPDSEDKAFVRSLVLHLRDPAIRGR